jgi:starch synthase
MDILFAATELHPLAKVGGLADVVAALSKSLRQLGHKVTLAMPRFSAIAAGGLLLARRLTPIVFDFGGTPCEVTVYDGRLGSGVEIVLFDVPGLYDRPGVYGQDGADYPDNPRRFAVFCRAVVELARQRAEAGAPFDVIHVHDWPAALVPVYAKELAQTGAGPATPVVLTIHNLAHQGLCPKELTPTLGLPWSAFHPEYLEYYGQLNPLKGGIVAADKLTTVSVTYAREIQTEEQGHGLGGVLSDRKSVV